jgi:hypothetical protein
LIAFLEDLDEMVEPGPDWWTVSGGPERTPETARSGFFPHSGAWRAVATLRIDAAQRAADQGRVGLRGLSRCC